MFASNPLNTTDTPFPLLHLPPETIGMVIEEIEDLETLLSVSQSCKALNHVFCRRNKIVVQNIFASYDRIKSPEQRAIQMYQTLELALSCRSLSLPALERVFSQTWPLFRDIGIEETLYPIATRLALCLSRKGHSAEQKLFLEKIWNADAPYEVQNYRRRSPNLIPIAKMLEGLVGESIFQETIRTRIYEFEQVKKSSKPYFIHIRNNRIVYKMWDECNATSLTAFLLPGSKRVAELSFNTRERNTFQASDAGH